MEKETTQENIERPKHLFRRRNTSQSIELEETREKDERSSEGHATDEDAFSSEVASKEKSKRTKATLVKKDRKKESANSRVRKTSDSTTASESNYVEKPKRVRPKSSRSRLSSHSTVNIEFRNDGMEDLVVVQNPGAHATTTGSETGSFSVKEPLPPKEINRKQKASTDGGKKKQARFVPRKLTKRVEITKELIYEYYLDSLEVFDDPVYVPHAIWEQSYEFQMSRTDEEKNKDKQTMIRVGGGYMELPFYLRHHLPIKVYQRKSLNLSSSYDEDVNEFVMKSRRLPNSSRVPKHFERPSWCTVSNGQFKGFASTVLRTA